MLVENKQVILRKLVASEGKILVSKKIGENGKPVIQSKLIYLAKTSSVDDFEEIDEDSIEEKISTEEQNL